MAPRDSQKKPYHWGEQLRGDLVAEALRQVEPLGIAGLSTREVARGVGVSHAAPAHYFPDRLALAAAVAAAGFEQMYESIEAAVRARRKPSEKLLAACLAYVGFALESRGVYRTMCAPKLAERLNNLPRSRKGVDDFTTLSQLKAKGFGVFVDIVRDGQAEGVFRAGKADDLARAATAAAHGLARQFIDEGLGARIDRMAHARQVIGIVVDGLEVR